MVIKLIIVTTRVRLKILKGGMNMKAIFETGGKQYYVSENDVIYVEKLPNEAGSEVTDRKSTRLNSSHS